MKKLLALLLSLAIVGMAVGCSNANGDTPSNATGSGSGLSGKVATNGSTSMEKVIGALSEAFMTKYPDVSVTYDPTGSGTGITAATDGTADIGLSSRSLKDDEKKALTETVIALDGIAIIVNQSNGITNLTIDQLSKIATGEIKNWSEVGGKDSPIVLVGREAGSGTRDGFESILNVKDKAVYGQELTATGAVIAAVASNENAIGYASLSAVDTTVKAIQVEGVTPSEETVQNGSYKVQRPFVMATKTGAKLSDAAQAFLDFAKDSANAEIIKNAGAVPLAQ